MKCSGLISHCGTQGPQTDHFHYGPILATNGPPCWNHYARDDLITVSTAVYVDV